MKIVEVELKRNDQSVKMLMNDFHLINEIEREQNFYEHWMLEMIESGIKQPNKVWVDVGANVGNHTVFFGKFCQNRGVVCFEPLTESFNLLLENINQNGLSNRVIAHKVAVGAKVCQVFINRPSDDVTELSIGGASVNDMNVEHTSEPALMQPLDIVLKGRMDIGLIKIDVEGSELEVIRGAVKVIAENRPELFVETFGHYSEVLKLLPAGYELKERYNIAQTYHFSCDKNIPVTYKETV